MDERALSIEVEFYGVPRARCGVASTRVTLPVGRATLGELIQQLGGRFPMLAEDCFDGLRLRDGFTANIDGQRFVTAPESAIRAGEVVLLMSTDAGG